VIAVGASIILTVVGAIGMAVTTSVGAEITRTGSVDDIDRKDERDVQISRRGCGVACGLQVVPGMTHAAQRLALTAPLTEHFEHVKPTVLARGLGVPLARA